MKYEVDGSLFGQLGELDPSDVCSRASCQYDETRRCYLLSFWNEEYTIDLAKQEVVCSTINNPKQHDFLAIFLINYLMQVKNKSINGELVSEKDVPGGVTFFRGPHELPTSIITSCFKNNLEAFSKRCEHLYGLPLNMADKAYAFTPTPRLSFAVLYWQGDDEFGPESKLLFDKSFVGDMTLDTLFALSVEICSRVVRF